MKRCGKCGVEKPLSEFRKRSDGRSGYRSQCRACLAAFAAARRAAHPEKARASDATHYAAHREEIAATKATYRADRREKIAAYNAAWYAAHREESAAWRAANPETLAAYRLKRKYNLTSAERDEMIERQGGLCVCGLPATDVDHCHDCEAIDLRGSVRGILCRTCNQYLDHIARCSPTHAAYLADHAAVCPARAALAEVA